MSFIEDFRHKAIERGLLPRQPIPATENYVALNVTLRREDMLAIHEAANACGLTIQEYCYRALLQQQKPAEHYLDRRTIICPPPVS